MSASLSASGSAAPSSAPGREAKARSPLDSILERAHAITRQAVLHDQKGELEAAIARYEEAVQVLVLVAQNEERETLLDGALKQIDAARNRIERLREVLKKREEEGKQDVEEKEEEKPLKEDKEEEGKEGKEKMEEKVEEKPRVADEPRAVPSLSTDEDELWEQVFSLHGVLCFEMVNPRQPSRQLSAGEMPLLVLRRGALMILQIGDFWRYELLEAIPVLALKEERHFYVLPGLGSEHFYGLMFPYGVDSQSIAAFEGFLGQHCMFGRPEERHAPSVDVPVEIEDEWELVDSSDDNALALIPPEPTKAIVAQKMGTVAQGVQSGGGSVAKGIRATGRYVSSGLLRGGTLLKASITPAAEQVNVPQPIKDTVHTVASLSPHVVAVSAAVSASLTAIAGAIATEVGRGIRNATKSDKPDSSPSIWTDPRVQAGISIGKAGLVAAADIWGALEEAGGTIFNGAASATVGVLEHAYGEQVGEVARETVSVGVDTYQAVSNLRVLTPKRLATTLAVASGKSAVVGYLSPGDQPQLPALPSSQRPLTVAEAESDSWSSSRTIEPPRDSLRSLLDSSASPSVAHGAPTVSDLPEEKSSQSAPFTVQEAYLDQPQPSSSPNSNSNVD